MCFHPNNNELISFTKRNKCVFLQTIIDWSNSLIRFFPSLKIHEIRGLPWLSNCLTVTYLNVRPPCVLFGPFFNYVDQMIGYLKSDNLQYNTLGCWVAGTNDSSTKGLMFQVLFFFHNFLQNSLQKFFQFIFL